MTNRLLQVLLIACSALATVQNSVGGYRHVFYLDETAVVKALEINFILRGVNIVSCATGKASIGALQLRLLGPMNYWQKWVIWAVIILTAIVNVLNCIFNFVQCSPVEANWTPGIPSKCWSGQVQLNFAYFMCGTYVLSATSRQPGRWVNLSLAS
ncbi:hypothetical protein VTN96DRAFT_1088 [Rasamsonia emersonii]